MAHRRNSETYAHPEMELIGDDFKSVKVPTSLLRKFNWFSAMIDFDPTKNFIKFGSVNGALLEKIKEWMEYEGSGQMPATTDPDTKSFRKLTTWEINFFRDISNSDLVVLMKAADFFDLKNFQEVLTDQAAKKCTALTIPEIRAMFEIVDSGYTPQQEQNLESEARWIRKLHE